MKCIQCNRDNDLRDRTANRGRCKYCKHPFAFEPTTMEAKIRFTDGFFAKALADISANGTLFFTRGQLLYLLKKRLVRQARFSRAGCVSFLMVYFIVVLIGRRLEDSGLLRRLEDSGLLVSGQTAIKAWLNSWLTFEAWWHLPAVVISLYLGVVAGLVLIYDLFSVAIPAMWLRWSDRRPQQPKNIAMGISITESMVDSWLKQWERFHGSPSRLLPPLSAPASLAPAVAAADVTAYSFDRVLVCESVAIAQLLIANNIHFEHNCAVLSISGYPQAIFATTMAMLRRNPDLQVIALHSCSPQGVAMINELRTSPDWYVDSTQVIFDLGMLPRQVAAARGQAYIQVSDESARAAHSMPQDVRQPLTATETKWLEAGYFVDLESFTPKKLIQIVSLGIARMQNLSEGVDDNLILVGGFGSDEGTFIYASDNFG